MGLAASLVLAYRKRPGRPLLEFNNRTYNDYRKRSGSQHSPRVPGAPITANTFISFLHTTLEFLYTNTNAYV
ncbi:hypothetical protein PAL_GLEAN10005246 [Pteropus alecto]|uniref:Uncharacterized protein n=1 Tax=Pteropus alecto TaxID=9402 RepID=L5JW08_PTEAL|nr:hypothetical protein PAL_GLEAN10005246 [Pteropus alecto]